MVDSPNLALLVEKDLAEKVTVQLTALNAVSNSRRLSSYDATLQWTYFTVALLSFNSFSRASPFWSLTSPRKICAPAACANRTKALPIPVAPWPAIRTCIDFQTLVTHSSEDYDFSLQTHA